jgi:hypothetical protein
MNVVHRSSRSMPADVANPDASAEKAYSRMPPAEPIGQIAAQQAEDAARDRRHVKQQSYPIIEVRSSRLNLGQIHEGRPHDERQHQQRIGVEGEAYGGYRADHPLDCGQLV